MLKLNHLNPLALLLASLSILSACGTIPDRPPLKDGVDVNLIPEPVPVAEPRSKYGNPESYVQDGKRYWVMPNANGYVAEGRASWYGKKFDGRRTSSGETYNMYDMTAAHTTLPLPTYVRVTNLSNQKNVILRVNDRGPFVKNRLIDLSYAAASKLGVVGKGTAAVRVEALNPGDYQVQPKVVAAAPETTESAAMAVAVASPQTPVAIEDTAQDRVKPATQSELAGEELAQGIYVQVGAYTKMESAEAVMVDVMEVQQKPVLIVPIESSIGILHRVRIGPFASNGDAETVFPQLRDRGYFQYRIVRQ